MSFTSVTLANLAKYGGSLVRHESYDIASVLDSVVQIRVFSPRATALSELIDCVLSNASPTCYAVVNGVRQALQDQTYNYSGGRFLVTGRIDLSVGDRISEVICSIDGIDVFTFSYEHYASINFPLYMFIDVRVVDGGLKTARVAPLDPCARAVGCYAYEVDVLGGRCRAFLISLPYGGRVTTDCPGAYINGTAVDGSMDFPPGVHVLEFRGLTYGDTVVRRDCTVTVGSIKVSVSEIVWGWV